WWATWGGLKLPPKSAIRMRPPLGVLEEGAAALGELALERGEPGGDVVDRRAGIDPAPDRVAAREQIDRWRVLDELVRLRPPPELILRLAAGRGQQGDAGPVGAEPRAVGHVQLDSAARAACELLEHRPERERAEAHARERCLGER